MYALNRIPEADDVEAAYLEGSDKRSRVAMAQTRLWEKLSSQPLGTGALAMSTIAQDVARDEFGPVSDCDQIGSSLLGFRHHTEVVAALSEHSSRIDTRAEVIVDGQVFRKGDLVTVRYKKTEAVMVEPKWGEMDERKQKIRETEGLVTGQIKEIVASLNGGVPGVTLDIRSQIRPGIYSDTKSSISLSRIDAISPDGDFLKVPGSQNLSRLEAEENQVINREVIRDLLGVDDFRELPFSDFYIGNERFLVSEETFVEALLVYYLAQKNGAASFSSTYAALSPLLESYFGQQAFSEALFNPSTKNKALRALLTPLGFKRVTLRMKSVEFNESEEISGALLKEAITDCFEKPESVAGDLSPMMKLCKAIIGEDITAPEIRTTGDGDLLLIRLQELVKGEILSRSDIEMILVILKDYDRHLQKLDSGREHQPSSIRMDFAPNRRRMSYLEGALRNTKTL